MRVSSHVEKALIRMILPGGSLQVCGCGMTSGRIFKDWGSSGCTLCLCVLPFRHQGAL
jgi:hypothetical protein